MIFTHLKLCLATATHNFKSTNFTNTLISTKLTTIIVETSGLGGRYSANEISHNFWLWLKGHNFTSLVSVFGEKGPNKFGHKGNILVFGEVASAHPGRKRVEQLANTHDPTNSWRRADVGLTLAYRLLRWPNIKTTLVKNCHIFII